MAPVQPPSDSYSVEIPAIPSLDEREYRLIRDRVYQESRINLGNNKQELVSGRISKRLRHLGMHTYEEYCRFLETGPGQQELRNLIDAISTNYTSFFREAKHFEFLQKEILAKLDDRAVRSDGRKFRVWSAACSSGEEPYSLAICLADFFSKRPAWSWKVDATDISSRMLAAAEAGIYEVGQVKLPNPEWLRRYFQRGFNRFAGHFRVKPGLREKVQFHHVNLFQARYPFSPGFQVVFCRNVMIYFDRPTQHQLIQRITEFLAPGGFLFIGPSESLIGIKHTLRYLQPSIYSKER